MPFKYFQSRRSSAHSAPQKKRNWSGYNKRMKRRGDIAIWLSPDVVQQWHVEDRHMMEMVRRIYIVTWPF